MSEIVIHVTDTLLVTCIEVYMSPVARASHICIYDTHSVYHIIMVYTDAASCCGISTWSQIRSSTASDRFSIGTVVPVSSMGPWAHGQVGGRADVYVDMRILYILLETSEFRFQQVRVL